MGDDVAVAGLAGREIADYVKAFGGGAQIGVRELAAVGDRKIGTRHFERDDADLLFARGNALLLRDVVVDGRKIVSEGRCSGVDLPAIDEELRGIYRTNARKLSGFQRAWPPLSASLQNWFATQLR